MNNEFGGGPCKDCSDHSRVEEMLEDRKNAEKLVWEDLKKHVSFKVFSAVLSIIVTLMSIVIPVQFYQIRNVHQDLLTVVDKNHQELSDWMNNIVGDMSSLAIAQSAMSAEIKNIHNSLNRLNKNSEEYHRRLLLMEQKSFMHHRGYEAR